MPNSLISTGLDLWPDVKLIALLEDAPPVFSAMCGATHEAEMSLQGVRSLERNRPSGKQGAVPSRKNHAAGVQELE
jgi:hypothetical protein